MANTGQIPASGKQPPEAQPSSIRRGRRRGRRGLFHPLGEQSKLVNTSRTNLVHDGDDVAIFGARIAPHINGLVEPTGQAVLDLDRKSTRLNSSHGYISYAVFCLKKKNK